MWTIIVGAVIGLLLGSAFGGKLWFFGAITGALVGGYFFRNRHLTGKSQHELEQRLLTIEQRLAEQRSELEVLRRLVAPGEPSITPPVVATAEPASPPPAAGSAAEAPAPTTAASGTAVRPPHSQQRPLEHWVDLDALLEPRKPSAAFGKEASPSDPQTAESRPDPMADFMKGRFGIGGERLEVPGWLRWFW